jgi:acyl-CoA thioesterase II
VLVAETDAPIRIDGPDAAPELWFPAASTIGEALATADGAWRRGEGELADHIAFDHERVSIEVIDAAPGDDPRDVTTKRWPTWGDAADLIEIIDVQPDGDGRYRSAVPCFDHQRPVAEGSQILGQSIVAAARHRPGRRVVSASMVFPRPADSRVPYQIGLDEVTDGRTFTALRAEAVQGGRTCAFGTLLLDVTAPDLIRHADPPPDAPGPYQSTPFDMSVTGRDLRIVEDAYTGDPDAPLGPPELDAWVRFRTVPDDPAIHAGLCAQLTGHLSIAAALRPHAGIGQDQAHRTISTAINAISLSIHADIRADRWMRYHHRSTFAGHGMTHSECRVYDEDAGLLASFTVDAMVRAFTDPSRAVDDRTAM